MVISSIIGGSSSVPRLLQSSSFSTLPFSTLLMSTSYRWTIDGFTRPPDTEMARYVLSPMSASMAPWARTGISISPSRTSLGMPRTFFTRKPTSVPIVRENVFPTHMRSP